MAKGEVFDSGAHARSGDPQTSKDAAKSVGNLRASHRRVLAMFKLYGDMTDGQLAESIHDAEKDAGLTKLMSPSGVRSRRSELSKPNMDRMDEIAAEITGRAYKDGAFAHLVEGEQVAVRARLIVEGIKSPLWDTGKRVTLDTGRQATVWGIAQ